MWAFWEARPALGWIGHGSSIFLLLNQTYVLSNVRPELFIVYSCPCFSSVLFLFFTTDIHSFIYFTLFLKGFSSRWFGI